MFFEEEMVRSDFSKAVVFRQKKRMVWKQIWGKIMNLDGIDPQNCQKPLNFSIYFLAKILYFSLCKMFCKNEYFEAKACLGWNR